MRPLPWLVPAVSPLAGVADEAFADGMWAALSLVPSGACSMLPAVETLDGKDASICAAAVRGRLGLRWRGSARSTKPRAVTAMAQILQLAPLRLGAVEARQVASRQHGPRHCLPELARLRLYPLPARNELGFWKGNGSRGRMGALPNRYSRDAEAVLQYYLRASLIAIIKSGFDGYERVQLAHFRCAADNRSGTLLWESALAMIDGT